MVDEDGNLDLDEGDEFNELNGNGEEGWEVHISIVELLIIVGRRCSYSSRC